MEERAAKMRALNPSRNRKQRAAGLIRLAQERRAAEDAKFGKRTPGRRPRRETEYYAGVHAPLFLMELGSTLRLLPSARARTPPSPQA
jgi:hypothetical protein